MEEALKSGLTIPLIKASKEAMDEVRNGKHYAIGENNYHLLSSRGKYVMGVFQEFNKLCYVISDLKMVETFLRRFPTSKFFQENSINQLAYTQYHIEVLIHKIHTVLEIKKLMLNKVFKLGLSEKDCTWENLKDIPEIKQNKAHSILNSYYKIFRHIIEARHLNTHRGIFDDKEKNDLNISKSIYEQYEVLGLEIEDKYKQFMPEIFLAWKIKEYRKDRLKWVKNAIKIAEDHVRNFFDSLTDEFISKKNEH